MERWQLTQMQSLPLEIKIEKTTRRIREWYEHWRGQIYISFSGGKQSTLLLHLARSAYPDLPAVFADTGMEYPEIREFVKTYGNVEIIRPKMAFRDVLEKYGYPVVSKEQARCIEEIRNSKSQRLIDLRLNGKTLPDGRIGRMGKLSEKWKFLLDAPFKISAKCCDALKKAPFTQYERQSGRWPVTGETAEESLRRRTTYLASGCNAFAAKRPKSMPLGFWTEQDVLRYLKEFSVPYCSIYGDIAEEGGRLRLTGQERVGCFPCMFGAHLEKTENRFIRLERTHPQLWKYCIHTLGLGEVLDYIGVPYSCTQRGNREDSPNKPDKMTSDRRDRTWTKTGQ
jgi:3'-phosphoadenosine 5'-phosphosulfate sulfotransferase (PAPS reductase)/FAD synthetase